MISLKVKIIFFLLLFTATAHVLRAQKQAKKVTISGYVTTSDKKPVPGTVIFVDDVNTNQTTNDEGFFKITVKAGAQKVSVFSFTNGAAEEIIGGRTRINFLLREESSELSEKPEPDKSETVSDGYTTIEKSKSVSPGEKIDGQNPKYKSYQNIFEMIRGEVTGARVTGTRIQIMGPSSFNGNDDPLFIVDGVEVTKIDDISPNQIKSIEVLKGSDAAIYGTRGGNGVLVIRLLSGKDYK
jgi:TonB-dependent SusC/RagA subfamily outer membrane receptor